MVFQTPIISKKNTKHQKYGTSNKKENNKIKYKPIHCQSNKGITQYNIQLFKVKYYSMLTFCIKRPKAYIIPEHRSSDQYILI